MKTNDHNNFKTETFNNVFIGNRFYQHGELFVKFTGSKAIGENGLAKQFCASQFVIIPIEHDRVMCA